MVSASNNTIHICKVLACDSKSGLRSKPFKGHQNLGLWRHTKTGLPQTEFKCLWFICQYVFLCVKNHLQSLNVMCTLMYTYNIYIDIYYCYSTKYSRFKSSYFRGLYSLRLEICNMKNSTFNRAHTCYSANDSSYWFQLSTLKTMPRNLLSS